MSSSVAMSCMKSSEIPEFRPIDFNDWTKLLRVSVFVFRFLQKKIFTQNGSLKRLETKDRNLWRAISGVNGHDKFFISAEDLQTVENFWIHKVQRAVYGQIFQSSGTKDPLVKWLGICQSETGLLVCQGRLQNSDLPPPILLPKNHRITELIVKDIHEENMHMRVAHTLALVQKRFWIPHGRVVVRNVLNSCLLCKRFHGGPFKLPNMPSLPQSRVTRSEPFQFTGLDYLGPFHVRRCSRENSEKRWICIFTCLAV